MDGVFATRFYAINGIHPMTAEDDAYASEWYVQLEALAETAGTSASELRRLIPPTSSHSTSARYALVCRPRFLAALFDDAFCSTVLSKREGVAGHSLRASQG